MPTRNGNAAPKRRAVPRSETRGARKSNSCKSRTAQHAARREASWSGTDFSFIFAISRRNKLSAAELEKLIGTARLHAIPEFAKRDLPAEANEGRSAVASEAIRMMAKEPNLIRRPVIVAGGRVVVGFDQERNRAAFLVANRWNSGRAVSSGRKEMTKNSFGCK